MSEHAMETFFRLKEDKGKPSFHNVWRAFGEILRHITSIIGGTFYSHFDYTMAAQSCRETLIVVLNGALQ